MNISRRGFLKRAGLGTALAALPGGAASGAAAARPNVLFILTDDQRRDTIGAYGNPHIHTPNLDGLAARGTVFTNAYCMGGFSAAVCMPSRMMILRGCSWFHVRDLPEGFPNMASSMNDAGYETFFFGKHGNTDAAVQEQFNHCAYARPKRAGDSEEKDPDQRARREGIPGEHTADAAIAFLQERDREKPFFMYLAGPEPHDPRVAPQACLDMYPPDEIPLPPNFAPYHPFDNGELLIRDERLAAWPRTEAEIRKHLQEYYAVITYMDAQYGRIFQSLRDTGAYENTIVVFASDQGIAIGSHGLMGKQNLYEHSMGAPLIFAGPGIPEGRQTDAFAYLFDIFPTLCELTGTPIPASIEGRSLAPMITGVKDTVRDTAFLGYKDVQRAVRQGRWKLIRYPRIDLNQLFDLETDPFEIRNLAKEPEQQERVRQLLDVMRSQQKIYRDEDPLAVDQPQPGEVTLDYFKAASKS